MSITKAQQAKAKAEAEKRSLLSQLEKVRNGLLEVRKNIDACIRKQCEETVARFETNCTKRLIYHYQEMVPHFRKQLHLTFLLCPKN